MWNTQFVDSVEIRLITQNQRGFSPGTVSGFVKIARFDYQVKIKFIMTQVLGVQYLLLVLFFCREITRKLLFYLFCETSPQLKVSWNTVGYWVWKIQQISLLFDYCELWYQFVCTGFMAVCNPRLLIVSLTIRIFYGFFAISDFKLLIISLTVAVCAGVVAVFYSRLLIISLIAFNGVPWYGGAMRRLCWWGMTVKRRKILRGMVRLTNYWSVKVHGSSHVESSGCWRESWHTLSMSNAFTTSVFNLIVKGSEFFKPTSS